MAAIYPHTPRFANAVKQSGRRKSVVDLYYAGVKIENDLPVSEATITVDRKSRSRRSGSVVITDPSLFPRLFPEDRLSPFGAELVLRSGIVYPDNTQELVPMGHFLITEVSGAIDTGLIPTATLLDRAERVFEQSVAEEIDYSGVDVFGAIASLIGEANPSWSPLQIGPGLVNRVVADGQFETGTDRWQIVSDMALSIHADVYFNRFGDPQMTATQHVTPLTNINNSVLTIASGDEGVIITAGRVYARAEVYSAVHVVGAAPEKQEALPGQPEPLDPPIPWATVYNRDPLSLTNWDGPFGHKMLRISDSTLIDTGACYELAIAKLRASSGLGSTIDFTCLANPALDVGDVVLVKWPDGREEFAIIDTLSLNLVDGSMAGTTVGITHI